MLFKKVFLGILFLVILGMQLSARPGVNEQLALQYYQEGDYGKAASLYKDIYLKTPTNLNYNYYLNSLFGLQDYNTAEKFIKSLIKKYPEEIKFKVELGYVYELAGNTKKAEKIYKKAFKNVQRSRGSYIALSNAFQNRGHSDFAEELLIKGKNKFEPPLNVDLADLYFAQGEYNKMMDSYLDLIQHNDDYLDLVKGKLQLILASPGSSKVSEATREELLKRTQKYPSKTIYAELLYWYSVQKREFDIALIQAKSLDRQFNEGGERVFQLSNILISNEKYDKAVDGFNYILSLGKNNRFYKSAEINVLFAKFKDVEIKGNLDNKTLLKIVDEYNAVINKYGKNRSTVSLMRNLAKIQAYYLHNTAEAESLLNQILNFPQLDKKIEAEVKLELGDVLLFEGKKWSASLLYKQVEKSFKNDPIGYEAKFKAAKFFYYVGEMEWAKVQLDVLKGATSKLIANDAMELSLLIAENIDPDSTYSSLSLFAEAELLVLQKKYDEAFMLLDTIDAIFPGYTILPNVEYKRAEIYFELRDYQKAAFYYNQTAVKYSYASIADNAMIKLAHLYDNQLNDKAKAKEIYEQILLNYPGSLFTIEARKRFNEL